MKFFELKRGKNTPPHFSVQKSSCSNPEKTPSLFSCTKTQLFEFRVGAFREKIPLLSSCAKRPMFENTVSYPHQLTVQALVTGGGCSLSRFSPLWALSAPHPMILFRAAAIAQRLKKTTMSVLEGNYLQHGYIQQSRFPASYRCGNDHSDFGLSSSILPGEFSGLKHIPNQ